MKKTIVFLALLSVVFAGCFTKKKIPETITSAPAQKFKVDIRAENLSENGTKVSTQNDEIVFLIYLVSPDTGATPELLLSEYAVFDSLHSAYTFEADLKPSAAGELYFVLVEIDSDKNKEQVEPVVRLNLRTIAAAYALRDPGKWIIYLGDDDLLGIKTMNVEELNEGQGGRLTMEGMKLLDAYKYSLNVKR